MTVEPPGCQLGYTVPQLKRIFGDRFAAFTGWMRGQTAAICEGRRYDHDAKAYVDTGCGPHGVVVYSWDVNRFLTDPGAEPWD